MRTQYDKIFEEHVVAQLDDQYLLYIDRHLIHEVTSPQAFQGLSLKKRSPWRKDSILAVPDHNVPTEKRHLGVSGIEDPLSRLQVETLEKNCKKWDLNFFELNDIRQGIVHVVAPEQGFTHPGMTIVCGDSHTSTHGAFGALAHGIGTSEVEHVLATQCLIQKKAKNMRIVLNGQLSSGVFAKDIILYLISQIGASGGTGYALQFDGNAIAHLLMEDRMTICNMAIEAGAKSGLMPVDQETIRFLKERPFSPMEEYWERAVEYWYSLNSDEGAFFDKEFNICVDAIEPQVSWGTSPDMSVGISQLVPELSHYSEKEHPQIERALDYMGLKPGQAMTSLQLDRIFIGSCTNARLQDLIEASRVIKGRKVAKSIKQALVVPGSGLVKQQAEKMGLDKIFIEAGFEWRSPGCSMCLAMNNDRLLPKERCASTSNRNFEGRQGNLGRTHLVSPATAAAAAIAGHFVDVRDF